MIKKLITIILALVLCAPSAWGVIIIRRTSEAVTYIDNLPCTDNAATQTVTNNGTGSDWTTDTGKTTADLYSTTDLDGTGNSFLFNNNDLGIQSTDNVTTEKFELQFYHQSTVTGAAISNEEIWGINSTGLGTPNNSITLWRPSGNSEVRLVMQSNTGSTTTWNSTNWPADTSTHLITITVDASGATDGFQSVVMKYGTTTVTWDSSTYPTGIVAFNAVQQLGTMGSYEPNCYVTGIKFEDQQ